MASINWKTGTSGDWTQASNWSSGTVPAVTSNVIISAAPAIAGVPYTVSLAAAEQVNALTLAQTAATLELDTTTLTIASTLKLSAGTLSLFSSTLTGVNAQQPLKVSASAASSVDLGRSLYAYNPNVFANLVWDGSMDLVSAPSQNYYGAATVSLQNVTFAGLNGSGAGHLSVGANVTVMLDAAGLSNVDVTLGAGSVLTTDQSGTLSIAGNTTVTATGSGAFLTGGTAIVNAGLITVSNGSSLNTALPYSYSSVTFTNSGTISVSDGTFIIASPDIINSGLIAIGAGGYVRLGEPVPGTLTNTGSFAVSDGGTLSFNEALTTAQLAGFGVTAGTLGIAAALDNTGAVLTTGTGAGAAAANLLLDGGTITGGTIINNGGFAFDTGAANTSINTGTLTGVAFNGPLSLDNAELVIGGGSTLHGATPSTGATLALAGVSTLTLGDSQNLDHAVISLSGTYTGSTIIAGTYGETTATQLILGPHTALTVGGQATLQTSNSGDSIVNQGTITAIQPGSQLYASGLINTGHIALSSGAYLSGLAVNTGTITTGSGAFIQGDENFIGQSIVGLLNAGVITATQAGATLYLGAGLDNTGTIAVSNGATLVLNANSYPYNTYFTNTGTVSVTDGVLVANYATASQLETIKLTHSSVISTGQLTIDNAAPLRVGAGTALGSVKLTGGISSGTVIDSGQGIVFYGSAFLNNVTYQGALNVTRPLTTLAIDNNFAAISGATGTSPGLINLTGAGTVLDWRGSQALDNATLAVGNAALSYAGHATSAPTFLADSYTTPTSFGAHLTIQHAGTYATIGGNNGQNGYSTAAGAIASAATIHANLAHGQLSLEGASFTSTGIIAVSNTDTVTEGATAFTNAGAISIGSASTFAIDTYNYFASATFADTPFINTGSIALAGGTLTENTGGGAFPSVPILNTGTIRGAGLLDTQINNAGTIVATGGTLTLDKTLSGTGSLVVGTGATLNLTSAVGAGQRVTFGGASGVLGLAPAAFHAKLVRFAAGDAIDLAKTAATAAAFSGNAIVVTLSGGGTISLATTSALSGSLATTSDGHGGTLIDFAGAHAILAATSVPTATPTAAEPAWAGGHLADPVQPWAGSGHVHMQQA